MSEFLAEAQVLISPNTAGFAAALRAQVEAAIATVGPAVVPITAAPVVATGSGKVLAEETVLATGAINEQKVAAVQDTVAIDALGAAATKTSISQAELAAAEKAAARAHAQALRGIGAETLGLAGLRGATLAASAPFLVGATAAIVFAKGIKEASDQSEELNKTAVVFGRSAEEIDKFAKTTASALGISEVEALRAAGIFGNLFRTIKISQPVAAAMSTRLVKLASDLASFNNADPTRTLEALRSGLVGQARPLRVFGIFLSQARAQQEALIETGKKSVQSLTTAELVQARYNIILKDGAIANNDFVNTSGRLANQTRILKANLANLEGEIGQRLLPNLEAAAADVNKLFLVLTKLKDFKAHIVLEIETHIPGGEHGLAARILGEGASFLGPGGIIKANLLGLQAVGKGLDLVGGSADKAGKALKPLSDDLDQGARQARLAAFAIVSAAKAIDTLSHSSAAASANLLKIQSQGGGPSEQLPAAKAVLKADQQLLQQALSLSATKKGRATAVKKAREAIIADRALIRSLSGEISSAQEQAVSDAQAKAQQAADKAAQRQQNQTDTFIASFTDKGSNLQEQLSRASQSDDLKKQIAINRAIIANDKKEIAALQARIKHLHLQGQALKDARDAIAAAQKEIKNIQFEITQEQKQQTQNAQDVLNQKLDLRIQIADTTDNVKQQIAARRAKLKEITRELVAAKKEFGKNSLAWLQLKEAQAEQIKAIHDLQNQNKTAGKDSRKEAAEFLFSQLQAQQGFASNLLGNLIPSGQTAGLVGNPAPASSVSVAAQTADGKSKTSPTAGQHNTTNELLRRILHALERQNRADQAPEARHNRHVGAAIMDGSGGIHGA